MDNTTVENHNKMANSAFPFVLEKLKSHDVAAGLSKREYFAIHILSALSSNQWIHEQNVKLVLSGESGLNFHELSVQSADSLIAELGKKK